MHSASLELACLAFGFWIVFFGGVLLEDHSEEVSESGSIRPNFCFLKYSTSSGVSQSNGVFSSPPAPLN